MTPDDATRLAMIQARDKGAQHPSREQYQDDVRWLLAALARLQAALSNHLCEFDMADWLACSGGHGETCEVCSEADKGQHRHALLVRAEQAEAEVARLQAENSTNLALLEMLSKAKSPCGHLAAYTLTLDGGKRIDCLQCDVVRLQAERDEVVKAWIAPTTLTAAAHILRACAGAQYTSWGKEYRLPPCQISPLAKRRSHQLEGAAGSGSNLRRPGCLNGRLRIFEK